MSDVEAIRRRQIERATTRRQREDDPHPDVKTAQAALQKGESAIIEVWSSNLRTLEYNGSAEVLTVEFQTGAVYHYDAVPLDEFLGLLSSPSRGAYFHERIRHHYEFTLHE